MKLSRLTIAGISALIYLTVLGLTGWTVKSAMNLAVQTVTGAANSAFTKALVNTNWESWQPLLRLDQKPNDSNSSTQLISIDADIRGFAKGTDLVKVKIYNAEGVTLYSNDPRQIGEDKSANPGFKQAAKGRVATEMTLRGQFGAFDGDLYNRNLVSSYVPVRGPQGVEAVVEVYADRTNSIEAVDRQIYRILAWLGGFMAFGFAVFYWLIGYRREAASMALRPPTATAARTGSQETESLAARQALWQLGDEMAHCSSELTSIHSALTTSGAPAHRSDAVLQRLANIGHRAALQADALRTYQKFINGEIDTDKQTYDLQSLLKGIAENLDKTSRGKNLTPQILVSEGIPVSIEGDREKFNTLISVLAGVLVDRAVSGVVQFKAQSGPSGIHIDLISNQTDAPRQGAVELLQAVSLAQALGISLQIESTPLGGDWFSLLIPAGTTA